MHTWYAQCSQAGSDIVKDAVWQCRQLVAEHLPEGQGDDKDDTETDKEMGE